MRKTRNFPALADLINTLLGTVKQAPRVERVVVNILYNILCRRHKRARVIALPYYRNVCKHVCGRRNGLHQLSEICFTARLVVNAVAFQLFKQGYKVDSLA